MRFDSFLQTDGKCTTSTGIESFLCCTLAKIFQHMEKNLLKRSYDLISVLSSILSAGSHVFPVFPQILD